MYFSNSKFEQIINKQQTNNSATVSQSVPNQVATPTITAKPAKVGP